MKKEITIDGTASDWFEKATFTLKDTKKESIPKDLMSYAEDLIESYMKRVPQSGREAVMQAADQAYKKQKYYKDKAPQKGTNTQYRVAAQLMSEYEKLKRQRAAIKKRERYVNRFVALSLIACLLSIMALAFSYMG